MSIVSWNCQGLGTSRDLTFPRLREIRKKYYPEILFLMETKNSRNVVVDLHAWLGYDRFFLVDPIGKSGGLALFWKSSVHLDIISFDKNLIDIKVHFGDVSFYLSCVYGDPVAKNRPLLWERISRIGLIRKESWAMVGDFNDLLHNGEKLGGQPRSASSFQPFGDMISVCEMVELKSQGNSFTWGGQRQNGWIQCKLDRCFGNKAWYNMFPVSNQSFLDKRGSDHRPVLINLISSQDSYKGQFRYDKRFFANQDVHEAIIQAWCNHPSSSRAQVSDKIRLCRKALSKWKKSVNFNSATKIEQLQKLLELEQSSSSPDIHMISKLKKDLCVAYKEEEVYWQQKSRSRWLQEGDSNTKYFHATVKASRSRNWIQKLQDINGCFQKSEASKAEVAISYFSDLFKSSNPDSFSNLFRGFTPKVTACMNQNLIRPVTKEEVKAVVFSIKPSSAPGPDGMTSLFFQNHWDIVGSQVTSEVQRFFADGQLPSEWNYTHLFLLPKIPNPVKMQDIRPISLCTVLYKVISKILVSRLQPFMEDLISPTQSAFVSDRLISDNILIAHEIVHGLRTVPAISKEYIAVKSDMSKAFDRVEWNYLKALLVALGFHVTWIEWIMACVSSVTFSVLLNNQPFGMFKPQRGLRQGDPLSPFLFVLCTEGLTHLLNMAEMDESLSGIQFSPTGPSISHLLFADDSLFICKAMIDQCSKLKSIFHTYGVATGQVINNNKSSITFGNQVDEVSKSQIKAILGIENEGGASTYLGLPECFSGSKVDLLSFIHSKLNNRLSGWFAKKLSMGGKEVLLKAVAQALPVYAMSCFKLPKTTCHSLASAMSDFWWSAEPNKKKIHWISWENMCVPKEDGGFGFKDIRCFNQALLGKQAWRLLHNKDSLCTTFFKSRYYPDSDFLSAKIGSRPSYAWRSLNFGKELLSLGIRQQVGNGRSISVWNDPWLFDRDWRPPWIKNSFAPLDLKVSDLIVHETGYWNLPLLEDLFFPRDIRLILAIKPLPGRDDFWIWLHTHSGEYSTQSGYKFAYAHHNEEFLFQARAQPSFNSLLQKVWKLKTASKIKHFLWKAIKGVLPVAENLNRRGSKIDLRCQSCGAEPESTNHLLFTCSKARQLWATSFFPHPPNGFDESSLRSNFDFLFKAGENKSIPEHIRNKFPWLLWRIWKNRNDFAFEGKLHDLFSSVAKVEEDKELWITSQQLQEKTKADQRKKQVEAERIWKPPKPPWLKCNLGASWNKRTGLGGGSWILRNHLGIVLIHSRKAFHNMSSLMEVQVQVFLWTIESLNHHHIDKVMLASENGSLVKALHNPKAWPSLSYQHSLVSQALPPSGEWNFVFEAKHRNRAASSIANSVTSRSQTASYVASGHPQWLNDIISFDAKGILES